MTFLSPETLKKLSARKAMPGETPEIEFIPTGIYAADLAIGGGFPRGRVTEISGREATSKTTLVLIAAAKAIERGEYVALLETESALDLKWLERLGIPEEEVYMGEEDKEMADCHLHVWHPSYLESALETLLTLYAENKYSLIVLDSFGGSPVRSAAEGTMEDATMMKLARVGSTFKTLFFARAAKGNAAVVIVNQVYVTTQQPFYDALKPEGGMVVSSGGNSIPYLASLRIYMEPPLKVSLDKDTIMPDGEKLKKGFIIGKRHKGMIHKNKTGKPAPSRFEFGLMIYPESYINYVADLADTAIAVNLIEQRGAHYYFGEEKLAHGRNALEQLLFEDVGLFTKLETLLTEHIARQRKESHVGTETAVETEAVAALPGSAPDLQLQDELS